MALVAVIADTHLPRGGRRLPPACVERLCSSDVVIHAGDFTSLAFLVELEGLGPPVVGVAGNMDDAGVRAAVPLERVVEIGGVRIGVVHDAGPRQRREARLLERFPGCAAVVYGHTHVPQVDRHAGVWILNPGSPTERRRAPFHSMIALDVRAVTATPELVRLL